MAESTLAIFSGCGQSDVCYWGYGGQVKRSYATNGVTLGIVYVSNWCGSADDVGHWHLGAVTDSVREVGIGIGVATRRSLTGRGRGLERIHVGKGICGG